MTKLPSSTEKKKSNLRKSLTDYVIFKPKYHVDSLLSAKLYAPFACGTRKPDLINLIEEYSIICQDVCTII